MIHDSGLKEIPCKFSCNAQCWAQWYWCVLNKLINYWTTHTLWPWVAKNWNKRPSPTQINFHKNWCQNAHTASNKHEPKLNWNITILTPCIAYPYMKKCHNVTNVIHWDTASPLCFILTAAGKLILYYMKQTLKYLWIYFDPNIQLLYIT